MVSFFLSVSRVDLNECGEVSLRKSDAENHSRMSRVMNRNLFGVLVQNVVTRKSPNIRIFVRSQRGALCLFREWLE